MRNGPIKQVTDKLHDLSSQYRSFLRCFYYNRVRDGYIKIFNPITKKYISLDKNTFMSAIEVVQNDIINYMIKIDKKERKDRFIEHVFMRASFMKEIEQVANNVMSKNDNGPPVENGV